MKNSRHNYYLLTLFILGAVLLSACGGDTPTNVTVPNTPAAVPNTPAADKPTATTGSASSNTSGDVITLRFTTWGAPSEIDAYKRAIARFETAQGGKVKVDFQSIPNPDYDTKLTTMVAAHQEPDVALMESASIAFPLAQEGHFFNLQDFLTADTSLKPDNLVPNMTYYSQPGNLIGMGPALEMFMLYYNEDMFKAAGLTPPPSDAAAAWKWDQFVDVAKKLTIDANGKNAADPAFDPSNIKQFGVNFGTWWGLFSNFVYSNGGDFVSADGSKFALNQPEAVEAIQKLADLINKYHVAPSAVQAKTIPSTNIALQTKKVAMVMDGQWASYDLAKSQVHYNVGVLPVLKTPVTTVVCGMLSIFKSSKHPQEAWALLKALLDPEGALELNKSGLWMPGLKAWYTDPALLTKWTQDPSRPSGYKGAAIDMLLNHGHPPTTGYVKNFSKINDLVGPALDKVWSGEQTAQQALDGVSAQAQAQVQGRRDVK